MYRPLVVDFFVGFPALFDGDCNRVNHGIHSIEGVLKTLWNCHIPFYDINR